MILESTVGHLALRYELCAAIVCAAHSFLQNVTAGIFITY